VSPPNEAPKPLSYLREVMSNDTVENIADDENEYIVEHPEGDEVEELLRKRREHRLNLMKKAAREEGQEREPGRPKDFERDPKMDMEVAEGGWQSEQQIPARKSSREAGFPDEFAKKSDKVGGAEVDEEIDTAFRQSFPDTYRKNVKDLVGEENFGVNDDDEALDVDKKEKPAGLTEWIEDNEAFRIKGSKNPLVDGTYRPDGASFGQRSSSNISPGEKSLSTIQNK